MQGCKLQMTSQAVHLRYSLPPFSVIVSHQPHIETILIPGDDFALYEKISDSYCLAILIDIPRHDRVIRSED